MNATEYLCIKIGGSVITDKNIPYRAKKETIKAIAASLKKIKRPMIIAHGSGSFGHTSAKKYGGKHGYTSAVGIAQVAYDAQQINSIVMEVFIEAGLPVISFSPRSFLLATDGALQKSFLEPILHTLEQGLIPVIYGDIIWDTSQKSTIFSGETTLNILCQYLQAKGKNISKIIQLCDVDGVLDSNKNIIPTVTKDNWGDIKSYIRQISERDATGGMKHKVEEALGMAMHGIPTYIINGNKRTTVKNALCGELSRGTLVA